MTKQIEFQSDDELRRDQLIRAKRDAAELKETLRKIKNKEINQADGENIKPWNL